MQNKLFILFCFVVSFLLHAIIVSSCSFYLNAKGSPVVYGWSNVINRKDLFLNKKNISFPSGVNFSQDSLRKGYLSSSFLVRRPYPSAPNLLPSVVEESIGEVEFTSKWNNYIYLWKQSPILISEDEKEKVTYRAYVSSYGKVLFMYPEKLPFNSSGNLRLQDYIRKATFFLDNRFFWTKLEGVVE